MKAGQAQGSSRQGRGFTRAGGLTRNAIRQVGERRGFAEARLLTHWVEIVGTEIAACTRPLKVSYTQGGIGATLLLLTDGAHAPLIQADLPRIRDRVNACYGYNAISRIRLTQTAPTGFADGKPVFEHAPRARPDRAADAALDKVAVSMTRRVADNDLRSALEALARNILSRSGSKQE